MIKFVFFDIGGVVVKDFSGTHKWEELIEELGIPSTDRSKFDKVWGKYSDKVCTTFDVDDLLPILKKEFNIKISQDYSLLTGFVSRFEVNKEIWPVVLKIKKEVPVGLLSNMYLRMKDKLDAACLFPPIDWDVIIDSSVLKLQKPDPAIYKLAEEKAKVKGSSILFVDNTQGHLDGAKKFNWQTFLFDPRKNSESCNNLLDYFNMNKD